MGSKLSIPSRDGATSLPDIIDRALLRRRVENAQAGGWEFRVLGYSGFKVQGLGFRVEGKGFEGQSVGHPKSRTLLLNLGLERAARAPVQWRDPGTKDPSLPESTGGEE